MRVQLLACPLLLACSDPPTAPPPAAQGSAPVQPDTSDDAWIEEAVEEALGMEVVPGTSGEPEAGRRDALRSFFTAHPEYREADQRAPLWLHACGLGTTEEAHAFLTQPPPKTPLELEVTEKDWRIFVAHADVHCTSDDWSYYTYEGSEAAEKARAVTGYGSATHDTLIVRSKGQELLKMPLSGQGYIVARAGQEPTALAYDPSIASSVTAYFR